MAAVFCADVPLAVAEAPVAIGRERRGCGGRGGHGRRDNEPIAATQANGFAEIQIRGRRWRRTKPLLPAEPPNDPSNYLVAGGSGRRGCQANPPDQAVSQNAAVGNVDGSGGRGRRAGRVAKHGGVVGRGAERGFGAASRMVDNVLVSSEDEGVAD